MSDQDSPGGEPSSPLDDVWARLRNLEDHAPATPARPDPPASPAAPPPASRSASDPPAAPPDHTSVMDLPPEASGRSGSSPSGAVPEEPRQFFVPAPGAGAAPSPRPPARPAAAPATPAARARAADQYRAATPVPNPAPAGAGGAGGGSGPPRSRSRRRNPLLPKAKWFRPKLRWIFLYLPLLIMLAIGGVVFWGWSTFNDLYRVDLGSALVPATGDAVNYLIVGSDSREGIDADTPNIGVIGTGDDVKGRRSDTIIVLRVEGDQASMMSIPRDLWVTNAATKKEGRINATYSDGPDNLVRTISANLGIPINRYIEVDFVSFAGMVDAMGGIEIDFAHPVIDPASGLKIATAGKHTLDGSMSLAYVRSRHYTEEIDGKPVQEPTGDLGRNLRQQTFIRTILKSVGDTRNPLTLAKIGSAAAKGVRVDTEVGFGDMVSLARQLSGVQPETKVLPVDNARKGQAAVLVLRNAEALPILAEFGAG